MKNKFWTAVMAVLIVLPSIFGVASYFSAKNAPVTDSGVSDIVMVDLNDETYNFSRTDTPLNLSDISTNMVQFFADVNAKADKEIQLPEPLMGTKYYKVTYNNNSRSVEYRYYFTDRPEYCYYTDDEDNCYAINTDYASAFLLSKYGRSVFPAAKLPKMTTPSGDIIAHKSITWTYEAIGKAPTYTEENPEAVTDTVYLMPKQLSLVFDIPVGSANVKITKGAEEVYNGLYDNLSGATLPTSEELTVSVEAKWYVTDDRQSEGTAIYEFKCKLTDDPEFYISSNGGDDIIPGDFVNINGLNVVCEPDAVKFSVTPELADTPVFYTHDSYVRALLPIAVGTAAGEYTATIEADGVKHELKFTVVDKSYSAGNDSFDSDALTEKTLADFDQALKEVLTAKSEGKAYITDEAFGWPRKGCSFGSIAGGFSRTLTTSGGFTYINNWLRVTCSEGTDVVATAPGKVVYTGEHIMTGNVVVVDHGLGLRSLYGNLTEMNVNVGDEVNKGDKLGVFGNTGYTDGSVLSFAYNINGTYVSPYDITVGDDGTGKGIVFITDSDVEDIELDEIEITDPTENPDYDPDPNATEEDEEEPVTEKETQSSTDEDKDPPETENAFGTDTEEPPVDDTPILSQE